MNSKPECVRQTPRFHHSVLSTTRSHRQLVKAVKIWKTAFVSSSNVTPGALKPRSFKERLMCVEMHRKASEVSTAPKSVACSIRDLQLCSSDSSPSPFKHPLESQHTRRRRPVHRRHYRKQLEWFHTLSRNKRPPRLNLEGQRSQTAVRMTGPSSDRKRRQRSSPSAQSPPEFQTPARKTSRRLWRRQLDTSSSDSSRSTKTTPADVKKTRRQKQNNTHKPCDNTNRRKPSWTEFNFLDIHSDLITDASPAHKTQKNFSAMSKKDKREDSPATNPASRPLTSPMRKHNRRFTKPRREKIS
ncbi:serine/arginine-rich splicing factor 11 [Triplophysa dalaica]|uniref:serine/arginine-rich splicing factor 11 n=1 Tax=Triplophysa dalaica TaxID=1582913 RepID=UPI0024DF7C97|nr:serine/arginine-rich splicing factor 11 [Triplophysa dalaica]